MFIEVDESRGSQISSFKSYPLILDISSFVLNNFLLVLTHIPELKTE